jgi:hypothetical protein
MLARQLFIGLIALATVPSLSVLPQGQVIPIHFFNVDLHFSPDVPSLLVAEVDDATGVPQAMTVRLGGYPLRPGDPSLLANLSIQVWLLRADGTVLARREKFKFDDPTAYKPSIDNMEFWFVPVPAKELAGVVVSINGKLLVREIKATPAS